MGESPGTNDRRSVMVMAAALIPNHRPKVKGQGWNFRRPGRLDGQAGRQPPSPCPPIAVLA